MTFVVVIRLDNSQTLTIDSLDNSYMRTFKNNNSTHTRARVKRQAMTTISPSPIDSEVFFGECNATAAVVRPVIFRTRFRNPKLGLGSFIVLGKLCNNFFTWPTEGRLGDVDNFFFMCLGCYFYR